MGCVWEERSSARRLAGYMQKTPAWHSRLRTKQQQEAPPELSDRRAGRLAQIQAHRMV